VHQRNRHPTSRVAWRGGPAQACHSSEWGGSPLGHLIERVAGGVQLSYLREGRAELQSGEERRMQDGGLTSIMPVAVTTVRKKRGRDRSSSRGCPPGRKRCPPIAAAHQDVASMGAGGRRGRRWQGRHRRWCWRGSDGLRCWWRCGRRGRALWLQSDRLCAGEEEQRSGAQGERSQRPELGRQRLLLWCGLEEADGERKIEGRKE
jgi:hypothetical protein